jgi:aminomethyltransferase
VIDDVFVYCLEEDWFLVIVNVFWREGDIAWMLKHKANFDVDVLEAPYAAAIAVQGPKAAEILGRLSLEIPKLPRFTISEVAIGELTVHVARTGYTGEDGFEIFAPAGHLLVIFDELLKKGMPMGLMPCGLGARDTLRTEVAYPLYGHELDENHTPLEAGLEWVVKWNKGDFIGRTALEQQKKAGLITHLVGFQVENGGVPRPGGLIISGSVQVGVVASGTFGPTVQKSIGMAFVPSDIAKEGAKILIQQGTREIAATTVSLPFYKKPKKSSPKVAVGDPIK